jgi:hypothetical protein
MSLAEQMHSIRTVAGIEFRGSNCQPMIATTSSNPLQSNIDYISTIVHF